VPPPAALRHPYLAPGLALIVLTFLAYANSFAGGLVLDNRGLLLHDPRIHEATSGNIRLILEHTYWWPNGESGLYRPFTTLSYLFNYAVLGNGEQPGGYHLVNFLLHAGNVLLVYALAIRTMRRVWPAFFVAAIWAVHPVLTESVTNIVGRADLLAAGALLGAVLIYVRSVEAKGWRRIAWLAGLALVTATGVLSKESGVVIPAAIVVYEISFRGGRYWGRAQWMGLVATLVPIALVLYQRSRVLSGTLPMEIPFTDNAIAGAGFWIGRMTALKVLGRYLGLIAWPAKLSADYSWSQIPLFHGGVAEWIHVMAALATVPAILLLYRWNRAAFFFFCVGFAWLGPASNLLFPVGTIMAERFLYLPALGLIACLVPAVYALAEKAGAGKYAPVLLCLPMAALAGRTLVRNADWKDDMTMATALVNASPQSFKSHDLLANVLFASDPSHGNIDRVIGESEKSRALLDSLPDESRPADPYRFAANCYMIRKDYAKATGALLRYIAINRAEFAGLKRHIGAQADQVARATELREADAYLLLSAAYKAMGNLRGAGNAAGHAVSLDPLSPELYRQLAENAAAGGRLDDAAVALVEGNFITGDKSLRQALVELYGRAMDPGSCALRAGPAGPAINPDCGIVHAHVCAASVPVVRTLATAGQPELAQTRKQMFVRQFGCPEGPLHDAFPEMR
jgi:tetratricopeptide (TPR) repeat protein